MGKLEFDRNCMEQTMDRIVERTMRMDMTWDWPCGVAYYGIAEAYAVSYTHLTLPTNSRV